MINVSTENGKIKVGCGKASGYDLIAEAIAACVSVVSTVSTPSGEEKCDEHLVREAFRLIVAGVDHEFINRYDIDILADCDDDDDDEEDDDDDDVEITVGKVPVDSEAGKKIMELLGIFDGGGDTDDETEDDLPDFLF